MRILHVIGELRMGGAEHALELLVRSSAGSGMEHFVAPIRRPGRRAPALARLAIEARRIRPSIVHGWMYHGSLAALAVSSISPGRPSVIWGMRQSLEGLDREKTSLGLMVRACARLSSSVSAIVYNSARGRSDHEARGYRSRAVAVIPNGFDTGRFRREIAARERLRGQLGVAPGEILIGSLARFHPVKDHETFVRAAAFASSSDARLRFLLAGPDGGSLHAVRRMAEEGSLRERLTILEGEHDPVAILSALDIFSLSSRAESFPNALGEAMSCELPCAATGVGDVREILEGVGAVIPPADPEALCEAWLSMARMPPGERAELGRLGRERVIGRYSMETMVEEYSKLYRSVYRPASVTGLIP